MTAAYRKKRGQVQFAGTARRRAPTRSVGRRTNWTCPLFFPAVVFGLADREQSVAAGREALDRWVWQYPWYDPQTDGVRPIEVSEPWSLRWKWLLEWLLDLFSFGWRGIRSMSWLDWLAWSGIALLLILLVYLMVRAFRTRERGKTGSAAKAGGSKKAEEKRRVEALPLTPGRKQAHWFAEAQRHYREGNYNEAIIYLFSYQLVQLDKSQLIRLAKGKTNRQYLRELGRRLTLRRLVEHTMVAFEDVFFGNYTIDRTRFESVWLRLGEFEALVAEGAAA